MDGGKALLDFQLKVNWMLTQNFTLMLRVKLPVVDKIQLQSNRFVTSVENKVTGNSKLHDSPVKPITK